MKKLLLVTSIATVCFASLSHAHVTLQVKEAEAHSYYRAVLQVPHGCSGQATEVVKVRIPEGMTGVRPMPKAGWEVVIVEEPLDQPFTSHGQEITTRVAEIQWRGGPLLDAHYDEFTLRGRLPDTANTTLYFPTVQECTEGGTARWIETESGSGSPAPALMLK